MNLYKILLVLCFAYSLSYKGQPLRVEIKPFLVTIFYLTGLTFGKPRYAVFLYVISFEKSDAQLIYLGSMDRIQHDFYEMSLVEGLFIGIL